MVKIKKISLFFVLIANVLMLASVAIPHHHHEQLICFDKGHCTNDYRLLNNTLSEADHQHDHDNCQNSCSLASCDENSFEQIKRYTYQAHTDFTVLHQLHFISILPDIETDVDSFPVYWPVDDVFIASSINIPSIKGLRAPPVV